MLLIHIGRTPYLALLGVVIALNADCVAAQNSTHDDYQASRSVHSLQLGLGMQKVDGHTGPFVTITGAYSIQTGFTYISVRHSNSILITNSRSNNIFYRNALKVTESVSETAFLIGRTSMNSDRNSNFGIGPAFCRFKSKNDSVDRSIRSAPGIAFEGQLIDGGRSFGIIISASANLNPVASMFRFQVGFSAQMNR